MIRVIRVIGYAIKIAYASHSILFETSTLEFIDSYGKLML